MRDVRSGLAWVLYWMGDGVSRLMELTGEEVLYPVYNTLMCWSVNLDDRGWAWELPR